MLLTLFSLWRVRRGKHGNAVPFLSWLVRLPEAGSLISGLGLIQTHTVAMDVSQALSIRFHFGKSPAPENLCYIILAFLLIKRSLCKADALAVWTTDRNCIVFFYVFVVFLYRRWCTVNARNWQVLINKFLVHAWFVFNCIYILLLKSGSVKLCFASVIR